MPLNCVGQSQRAGCPRVGHLAEISCVQLSSLVSTAANRLPRGKHSRNQMPWRSILYNADIQMRENSKLLWSDLNEPTCCCRLPRATELGRTTLVLLPSLGGVPKYTLFTSEGRRMRSHENSMHGKDEEEGAAHAHDHALGDACSKVLSAENG